MARFPKAEAEIMALAQAIRGGLEANSGFYPDPPVATGDLDSLLSAYQMAKNTAVAAEAAAKQATATKDGRLQDLINAMKTDIRYAENTVRFDDAKLGLIGWGGRKPKASLLVPGQPRVLEAPRQGDGWIFLDWKEPVDGGAVAAYRIQRRQRPEGSWIDVGMAMKSEIKLMDQQRGVEFEYQVIAVNKAGESEPTNMVMAVL